MIVFVDIDETICTTPETDGERHYELAVPLPRRIKHINSLHDRGDVIVYWTARGSSSGIDWTDLTYEQLERWGCRFHEIRLGKPSYDILIDDKAFNDREYFSELNDID